MMNRLYFSLAFLFAVLISVHSQDDVNLFDFWKYYTDSENAMYKSSCHLAFQQLQERKEAMAQLQTKNDHLHRQETVREKLLELAGPLPEKTPLNARVTGVGWTMAGHWSGFRRELLLRKLYSFQRTRSRFPQIRSNEKRT